MNIDKFPFKHKPYAHQLEALKKSWNKKYFAYFMEMGCVDKNTEIFTRSGWKPITEYIEGEEILVPNEHGKVHWEVPKACIFKKSPEFIHFKSRTGHIDMMLTPDHRMLVGCNRYNTLEKYRWFEVIETTAENMRQRSIENKQGIREHNGFPTTIADNIFYRNDLNRWTSSEILQLLSKGEQLKELEFITEPQRRKVLAQLLNKQGWVKVDTYEKARLVHHWITMSGRYASLKVNLKDYTVGEKKDTVLGLKDHDEYVFGRRYGTAKPVKKIIHKGKLTPMGYCFRTSTGYCLFRRNHHIFITGNSGKTKVIIDNAALLWTNKSIDSMMVIAPKGCYGNWAYKEIPQHIPNKLDYQLHIWDASFSKKKREQLKHNIKNCDKNRLQIFVVNIESLASSSAAEEASKLFLKVNKKTLGVVDESTCIKNPQAKRTRKLLQLSDKFSVKRIATGSPINNSPFDVFSQCQFLEKGCLGFSKFGIFKRHYATFRPLRLANGQMVEIPEQYINLDDLSQRLKPLSYRIQKKDCMDLPPKIYHTRYVELSPEQKQLYSQLKEERFAEFQGQEMTTDMVLTLTLRLHQIICGHFKADDGQVYRIKNNPRINSLMELIPELTGKTIIFANYRDNIKEIAQHIGAKYEEDSYVTYYGDTSTENRRRAIEQFEDLESPVRFFIGNTQTAGRGITLVAAQNVVYYSNSYSLEDRQQSEDRAHRAGQTKSVNYIDLCVKKSIDEKIIRALLTKRDISQEILQDDLERWFKI